MKKMLAKKRIHIYNNLEKKMLDQELIVIVENNMQEKLLQDFQGLKINLDMKK